jgi:hypothetical protein
MQPCLSTRMRSGMYGPVAEGCARCSSASSARLQQCRRRPVALRLAIAILHGTPAGSEANRRNFLRHLLARARPASPEPATRGYV